LIIGFWVYLDNSIRDIPHCSSVGFKEAVPDQGNPCFFNGDFPAGGVFCQLCTGLAGNMLRAAETPLLLFRSGLRKGMFPIDRGQVNVFYDFKEQRVPVFSAQVRGFPANH
jgi:hypothetical protein